MFNLQKHSKVSIQINIQLSITGSSATRTGDYRSNIAILPVSVNQIRDKVNLSWVMVNMGNEEIVFESSVEERVEQDMTS